MAGPFFGLEIMKDKSEKKLSGLKLETLLKEIRDRLDLCTNNTAEQENRKTFVEDTEFENGKMWDEDAKKEREEDGRPCITINKTQQITKNIIGDALQNKITIKVKPVDGDGDPYIAELYNGIIKNIETTSQADTAYNTAFGFAVRGGWGYLRVINEYCNEDSFDQDIKIKRIINPLSVRDDPEAQELDRSDRQFLFITDDIPLERYKKEYKDSSVTSNLPVEYGDQERFWIGDTTVRVAEYFRRVEKSDTLFQIEGGPTIRGSEIRRRGGSVIEIDGNNITSILSGEDEFNSEMYFDLPDGKYLVNEEESARVTNQRKTKIPTVEWYKTNGIEILEGPMEIPCKHIPVIFMPGDEIWIDGKQILRSALKWSKDPNRLYNWARSTAIETMSMAPRQPYLVSAGQLKGYEPIWDSLNRKVLPYLPYNDVESGKVPQRQQGTFPDMGADREAMMASDDIKSTSGKYDASLGAAGNETSGKAINARQRQSDVATFVFTDNKVVALSYLGRVLIDMIGKTYDSERVVRLLNEEGGEVWETINKAVIDPKTGQEVTINDVTTAKYDVVVTAGAAYATKREEALDGMIALVQAFPIVAPILAPRIAKNSDWPEAQEIGEEMQKLLGGPPPGGEGDQPPADGAQDKESEIDMINKVLTAQGKDLVNQERTKKLEDGDLDSDERTKQLITEALDRILEFNPGLLSGTQGR